ncbi:MAG: hypothetical protein RIQ81_1425, partial [Pseudomonadota bacterium]
MKTMHLHFFATVALVPLFTAGCGDRKDNEKKASEVESANATSETDDTFQPLDLTSADLKDAEKSNVRLKLLIGRANKAIEEAKKFCQAALDSREDLTEGLPSIDGQATAAAHLAAVDQLIKEKKQDLDATQAQLAQLVAKLTAAQTAIYGKPPIPKEEFKTKLAAVNAEIDKLQVALTAAKTAEEAALNALDGSEAARKKYDDAVATVKKSIADLAAKRAEQKELQRGQKPLSKRKPATDPTLVAALNSAKKELADRKPALEKIIKEISEEIASLEKHR